MYNNCCVIVLTEIIRAQVQEKYDDLVTRQVGQQIFSKLEQEVKNLAEGSVAVIDFSGVGVLDYSCADEVFARLLTRMQQNEYGEKFLVFKNLAPHHKENIHIVLEKKKLAALAQTETGWEVLGYLENYLQQALKIIMQDGKISSPELAAKLNLALNTASMRLRNLGKVRLTKKRGAVNSFGKRCYIYASLLGADS